MKSVPIWFHLQESSVVCPKCGSAIRVAHDLCLGCMLTLGMGVDATSDEALAELLDEMDDLGMLISS
jgi:predicted amidophosphoribosyltransferase